MALWLRLSRWSIQKGGKGKVHLLYNKGYNNRSQKKDGYSKSICFIELSPRCAPKSKPSNSIPVHASKEKATLVIYGYPFSSLLCHSSLVYYSLPSPSEKDRCDGNCGKSLCVFSSLIVKVHKLFLSLQRQANGHWLTAIESQINVTGQKVCPCPSQTHLFREH